jgi:hypothetical protein
MKTMVKVGKLSNGYERDKQTVTHAVEDSNSYAGKALCGTRPKIAWSERLDQAVTCPKCLKKFTRFQD